VLADATVAADRVRMAFEQAGKVIADRSVGATVSVGVACGAPGADMATLLAAADAELYRAKRNGRNRVVGTDVRPLVPGHAMPAAAGHHPAPTTTAWQGHTGIAATVPTGAP